MEGVLIMPKKLTIEEVKEYVSNNSDCVLLSNKYGGIKDKLKFKCGCGNEFERDFAHFKHRKQIVCKACSVKHIPNFQPITNEKFILKVKEMVGNEYTFKENYVNARTKLKVKHNVCGYEYSVTPDKFIGKNERRCPYCHGSVVDTENIFILKLKKVFEGKYEMVSDYKGSRNATKFKHLDCGHVFETSPDCLIRGIVGCHKCNTSRGERRIIDIFDNHNFSYKYQYRFSDLKNHIFDFVITDKNRELIAIEFDGIQHFKPIVFFGGEEKFIIQQQRDKIKDKYCEDNNIKLIRIPYWKFDDIQTILKDAII